LKNENGIIHWHRPGPGNYNPGYFLADQGFQEKRPLVKDIRLVLYTAFI
jgi:hypothetical protein